MKILLVEDNPENWDMLSRRLRNRGFEVVIAEDGRRALDMAASEKPDLILLDMGLPEMSGWDVANTLRKTYSSAELPIIALTAHATAEDRQQALEAGCDEFETKPVDLERLLGKIQATLGGGRLPEVSEHREPTDLSIRRHALLNPLNHVIGFTDLLLEELEQRSKDEIRTDLTKIRDAAYLLLDLVRSDNPRQVEHTPRETGQQRTQPEPGLNASVLVADDDLNNRALIVRILRKHGYAVSEAVDGIDALELLRKAPFDLVLCDVVMPRMDGVELLRQVKSELGGTVPVIVISALDQMGVIEECMDLDAIDFISKPFQPSVLLAKVGAAIRRKRQSQTGKGSLI